MAHIHKILFTLILILTLSSVSCEESSNKTEPTISKVEEEELVQSESKDGKLEIIKRIKKVNPDGSYTIGYEADDGSFKIESRDVLGNIKGTYGFVDDEGEIKRVSYSSSNASEIFTKHEPVSVPQFPTPSVVQRIPKNVKSSTTKKPSTYSTTTLSTPSTTPASVIQSIARRRTGSTMKPNYNNVENIKSTTKSNLVTYTSAAPRILLQRPSLASSSSTKSHPSESKSEGQISRPEVPDKPTERPLFKNSQLTHFEDEKPVTEETSEDRTNIFRRLPPQVPSDPSFNAEEHVYSLQQSLGHNDVSDIYNNGVTITSRPLFTTTRPNRLLPIISSTSAPVAVPKPISNYVANYQRNQLQQVDSDTAAFSQTTEEVATSTEPVMTSTNTPIVQIPANRAATPEPLVAIRHPFQQGAILVPLSQIQNRIISVENMHHLYNARRHYVEQQPHSTGESPVEIERQLVKKVNPPALRPLPVQVNENGFIKEMPSHIPTPYPLPIPVTPVPVQVRTIQVPPLHTNEVANSDTDDDVEDIQPPVSTRDFQKLLNHLIIRQKKLEKISHLINPKLRPGQIEPEPVPYQRLVPATQPYFIQRVVPQRLEYSQQQIQEVEQPQQRSTTTRYIAVRPEVSNRYRYQYRQENDGNIEPNRAAATYERQQSYLTNRRTARLLPPGGIRQSPRDPVYVQEESETQTEEYLPPEVRETLLLRMLQLAMNPALPLDDEEESQQLATSAAPQFRRAPVRNVEILGEEDDMVKGRRRGPVSRTKRYKEEDMEYME